MSKSLYAKVKVGDRVQIILDSAYLFGKLGNIVEIDKSRPKNYFFKYTVKLDIDNKRDVVYLLARNEFRRIANRKAK